MMTTGEVELSTPSPGFIVCVVYTGCGVGTFNSLSGIPLPSPEGDRMRSVPFNSLSGILQPPPFIKLQLG